VPDGRTALATAVRPRVAARLSWQWKRCARHPFGRPPHAPSESTISSPLTHLLQTTEHGLRERKSTNRGGLGSCLAESVLISKGTARRESFLAATILRRRRRRPGRRWRRKGTFSRINLRRTTPTPTGFAEIVGDDFPILHVMSSVAPFRRTAWLNFIVLSARVRRRVFGNADHSGADRTSDRAGAAQE
jgi:hypothetical protein